MELNDYALNGKSRVSGILKGIKRFDSGKSKPLRFLTKL